MCVQASWIHTWRQALSKFLGLLGILDSEGVEVTLASNLELDGIVGAALLYPRSCRGKILAIVQH